MRRRAGGLARGGPVLWRESPAWAAHWSVKAMEARAVSPVKPTAAAAAMACWVVLAIAVGRDWGRERSRMWEPVPLLLLPIGILTVEV